MTQRRIYLLSWLLLPLLALRGMVPAGFMLDMSGGEVSMIVCHGGMTKTVPVDLAAPSDSTQHAGSTVCPFAAAPMAATFVGMTPASIGFVALDGAVADEAVDFHLPFGPHRTQQSRAPPYFS